MCLYHSGVIMAGLRKSVDGDAGGMRRACVWRVILLLICLTVPTTAAHLRQGTRKPSRRPGHLYQVSTGDGLSGKRRFGFIDKTGKLVIDFGRLPRATELVREFREGRALIYLKKEKRGGTPGDADYVAGYIDETGEVIIAPRFEHARDFSEGLAYAGAKGSGGFIDRRGRVVIKVDFSVKDFHEGLAAAAPARGRGWGYIDRSGRSVIKPQYQFADDFSEGLAGVAVEGKYGFIDKRGEMVIPPRFVLRRGGRHGELIVSSGRFSEGLACVRVGELYGYINAKGDFVIPPRFARAQDFSEGLAWVVTRDEETRALKKAGWIDKSGRWVVTGVGGRIFSPGLPEFLSHATELHDWKYSEGLVPFIRYSGDRTLRGYMDRRGEVVIKPGEFDRAGPFVGGVARVSLRRNVGSGLDEAYGYIDRRGRFIWRSK